MSKIMVANINFRSVFFIFLILFCGNFTGNAQSCAVPSNIKVTSALSTKIGVEWKWNPNLPADYKVKISVAEYPTSNFFTFTFEGAEGKGEVTGLRVNTKYLVKVVGQCGTSSSVGLGLGIVRTLTKAEEAVLCEVVEMDSCEWLRGISIIDRGLDFFEFKLPPDAENYATKYGDLVNFYLTPVDATGHPIGAFISKWVSLDSFPLKINGLTSKTLYKINISNRKCRGVDLIDTPTLGANFNGPVFGQLPMNLTLNCTSPEPLVLVNPVITGGCSTPKVTFSDASIGAGCSRQVVRTWLAMDDCGRTSSSVQTISFVDNEPPKFIDLPSNNATIKCGENLPTESPTAVDNCSQVAVTSQETTTNGTGCEKTVLRTWLATDECGNTATYLQQIMVVDSTTESTGDDPTVPPLPVNCGQNFTPPVPANSPLLPVAVPDDVFSLLGFPVKVKEVLGSNGVFSGTAKVRLPFGNKVVHVEYNGIQVNDKKEIFLGELTGVSDPNFVFPDTGSINIGGEICLPEPPLLEHGFNSDGDYVLQPPYIGWQPGDPMDTNFDPNGFDANGINKFTGTKFNAAGCNQSGLDSLGNVCNPAAQGPYYWLQSNQNTPTTAEGIAYANELQPTIRPKVVLAIAALKATNQANITSKRAACGVARQSLETAATGLDKKYLFGENDVFLKEDMNLHFASKPIGLQLNVPDRAPQIVSIEEKHIDLYYCDRLLYRYKQSDVVLTDFGTEYGLDILVSDILEKIKHLSAEKVAELKSNPTKLADFIKIFVQDELNKKLEALGLLTDIYQNTPDYLKDLEKIGDNFEPEPQPKQRSSRFLAMSDAASLGYKNQVMADLLAEKTEDLKFEYLQGWEYVGNTHRAFYLDAIAKARDSKALTIGPDGNDPESLLPIRITKNIGGREYTILLDKIKFSIASGASLDAYFILDMPNTGQRLVFRATGVPFSPAGLAAANTKLALVSDVGIRLNNASKLHIIGQSDSTYVKWDCNGFAGLSVDAYVEFCRNYLTPIDPTTLKIDTVQAHRVKAKFKAQMPAWGEFVAQLTMDPFALTKHPDYKWEIQKATLDFSDVSNSPDFANISANYVSEFKLPNGNFSPQWKGFFLQKLKVTMPEKLSKSGTGNNPPISIEAKNLIIDDRGLTGLVTVEANILPLDKGNLSGWAFSINKFTLAVVSNRLQGGGFGGKLHVPIFSKGAPNTPITDADCFEYYAKVIITPTSELYEFDVKPADTMNIDIWVGRAILKQGSFVSIKYENDSFNIVSNLTGYFRADGSVGDGGMKLNLPMLTFENVRISNRAPYFRGGNFGLTGSVGAGIGGFHLSIKLPKLVPGAGGTCNFRIGADIQLCDKVNISAGTVIVLKGEMAVVDGRQRWKYKDFDIEKIAIDASWKGVDGLKGIIEFYKNDAVFGRGFRGQVAVKFPLKSMSIGVEAVAQFGSVNGYKYFLVDAMAAMNPGIDLGGIQIRALGGGAYFKMNRDTTAFKGLANAAPAFVMPALGVSLSGIKYVPDDNISIGVKLMVIIATSKEEIFNAGATLEVKFNAPPAATPQNPNPPSIGSINDIAFYGNGRIMAPIQFGASLLFKAENPKKEAPISFSLQMSYVFATKTLHGELGVFANVKDIYVGAGANHQLGLAVLHFDPTKWYINIGTPTQPCGVNISVPIGNTNVNLIKATTYLCVGTGIPAMPPLPDYVRTMTGASNFMADESRRASGRGFAMGASLSISTPEMKFLIFYAHLNAGLGFDLNMQKYDGITCANNNNEPLGINGWYASGQAWAYVDADVSLKWKSKSYTILNIGAAAALQMKMPNPFWAKGSVGGKYKILGGLVKGNCNFKFTLGKSCSGNGSNEDEVQNVQLIDELQPADLATNVDVTFKPTAFFGVQIGYGFTLQKDDPDPNNPPIEETFVCSLVKAELWKNGTTLVWANYKFSDNLREMTGYTPAMLEGNTGYSFKVSVKCVKANGQLVREETKEIQFTTGKAPENIPQSNVVVSYPLNGMYNFYQAETDKGYLILRDAQPYLLSDETIIARFSNKQGVVKETPVTVSSDFLSLHFPLPTNLVGGKFYKMELVIPSHPPENASGNSLTASTTDRFGENGSVSLDLPDKILHTLYFRASIYDKFMNKVAAFASGTKGNMTITKNNMEPFDRLELEGNGTSLPLIAFVHDDGTDGFLEHLKKLYKELSDMGYLYNREAVSEGSFLPPKLIKMEVKTGSSIADLTNLLANLETFEQETLPPAMNVTLVDSLFTKTTKECKGILGSIDIAISSEFSSSGYTSSSPTSGPNNSTIVCGTELPSGVPTPAYGNSTCMSSTYTSLLSHYNSHPKFWKMFASGIEQPTAGLIRPVTFSYRLPGTTTGFTTQNAKLDFKN
jgi:hypothetical protein